MMYAYGSVYSSEPRWLFNGTVDVDGSLRATMHAQRSALAQGNWIVDISRLNAKRHLPGCLGRSSTMHDRLRYKCVICGIEAE